MKMASIRLPLELYHTGFEDALAIITMIRAIGYGVRNSYHGCQNDFIICTEAILFSRSIGSTNDKVVQI